MILNIIKVMWDILPRYSKVVVIIILMEMIICIVTLNNEGRIAFGIGILGLLPILIITLILSVVKTHGNISE